MLIPYDTVRITQYKVDTLVKKIPGKVVILYEGLDFFMEKPKRRSKMVIGKVYREKATGKIGYYIYNTYIPAGAFVVGSLYFSSDPKSSDGDWSVLVAEHVEEVKIVTEEESNGNR